MFILDVTADDIAQSYPSAEHCPIATSARRHGLHLCSVGAFSIRHFRHFRHFPPNQLETQYHNTTEELKKIILTYDQTRQMKPMTLILI